MSNWPRSCRASARSKDFICLNCNRHDFDKRNVYYSFCLPSCSKCEHNILSDMFFVSIQSLCSWSGLLSISGGLAGSRRHSQNVHNLEINCCVLCRFHDITHYSIRNNAKCPVVHLNFPTAGFMSCCSISIDQSVQLHSGLFFCLRLIFFHQTLVNSEANRKKRTIIDVFMTITAYSALYCTPFQFRNVYEQQLANRQIMKKKSTRNAIEIRIFMIRHNICLVNCFTLLMNWSFIWSFRSYFSSVQQCIRSQHTQAGFQP